VEAAVSGRTVLLVGCGPFGLLHAQAWAQLGHGERLWLADPSPATLERVRWAVPAAGAVARWEDALAAADVVDIAAPLPVRMGIAVAALRAGKDVFLAAPAAATPAEAADLAAAQAAGGGLLQVGYLHRFHPIAMALRDEVRAGSFGALHHLDGRFHGFKRARPETGVVLDDAAHAIDLCNWLADSRPERVHAVLRDRLGRGHDDFALLQLLYPGDAVASIQVGLRQPGRWNDPLVAGATATRTLAVSGEAAAAEADFVADRLRFHGVRHVLGRGTWRPVNDGVHEPHFGRIAPVELLAAALGGFLGHIERRTQPEAGLGPCGLGMAAILDAVFRSAADEAGTAVRYPDAPQA